MKLKLPKCLFDSKFSETFDLYEHLIKILTVLTSAAESHFNKEHAWCKIFVERQ